MSDVSLVSKIGDRCRDGAVVELLSTIDLVAPRHAPGMEMSDPLNVVPNRPDDIPLHDLHVVNVIKQLDPGRIHALHHSDTEGSVIALISGMIDPAVEKLH